ncbi:hypothetical protein RB195_006398 [Necator americanus]|uniref:Uncharacterized protein n=1 Tax=Necator americanus TaxID=51031 RepID=A0ABR1BV93_NECAM
MRRGLENTARPLPNPRSQFDRLWPKRGAAARCHGGGKRRRVGHRPRRAVRKPLQEAAEIDVDVGATASHVWQVVETAGPVKRPSISRYSTSRITCEEKTTIIEIRGPRFVAVSQSMRMIPELLKCNAGCDE